MEGEGVKECDWVMVSVVNVGTILGRWSESGVFERGYWKSDDEKSKEAELLDASEGGEVTDGIIEDEDEEGSTSKGTPRGETVKRRTRIVSCVVGIAQATNGWVEGQGNGESPRSTESA